MIGWLYLDTFVISYCADCKDNVIFGTTAETRRITLATLCLNVVITSSTQTIGSSPLPESQSVAMAIEAYNKPASLARTASGNRVIPTKSQFHER